MYYRLLLIGVLAFSSMCSAQAQAQESTDWNGGTITAVGIGVPPVNARNVAQARAMAIRAAVADAQRNLLELLEGVNIDAETTVENAMANDVIKTQVRGVLRGARRVGDAKYLSDGSVEITVETSMRGGLADALLPQKGFSETAPFPTEDAKLSSSSSSVYTGLIINTRGLGLAPAMAPKVVDEEDQVVYGAAVVNREAAVQKGISAYEKNLDVARKNDRVGDNPLVIKGIKAMGRNKTNVMISSEDARKIRKAAENLTFLSQCRVILVLD